MVEQSKRKQNSDLFNSGDVMGKNAKKILVLTERIAQLEAEMRESLQKKKSNVAAYNVPATLRKIADLKIDIQRLQ